MSVAAEGCRSYLSKIDGARIVSRGFFGKDAQKNRLFLGFFAKLMLKFATKPLCVFRCFFKNHLNNCKKYNTAVGFENRYERMNMAEEEAGGFIFLMFTTIWGRLPF